MVRSASPKNEQYPGWYLRTYRKPVDFGNRFIGKTRQEYISAFKKLGFDDICECEDRHKHLHSNRQSRNAEQDECSTCQCLVFPHSYIYVCDECCEYALSGSGLVLLNKPFYCEYCA